MFQVFFDTSALLSGLNSPQGASGVILSLFKLKKISLIISPEVLIETERVMRVKFPYLATPFLDFLSNRPAVSKKLSAKDIQKAYKLVPSEDAPIFAGAFKSKADFLITLDKNFEKLAHGKSKVKATNPGAFLRFYRNS
ncbi:MAG: putative toxin-antitoxin system toxin component, PIN family [Candidatus Wildermuthbacteria bacterium]|nr:putative toxin-antitoxin system toxin component, PIN family [Candidatus Wildermuthbacteria bacterium]